MSKKKTGKDKKVVDATKKYFNPRTRQEVWDADYLHKLSPEEKAWYNKFRNESINANLTLVQDPLIKQYAEENNLVYRRAKTEMIGGGYTPIKSEGKPSKGQIHKTKEQAKEIFDSNNRRNNDLLGVTRINKLLEGDVHGMDSKKDIWFETDPGAVEDALIWAIDYKNNPGLTKKNYKKKK